MRQGKWNRRWTQINADSQGFHFDPDGMNHNDTTDTTSFYVVLVVSLWFISPELYRRPSAVPLFDGCRNEVANLSQRFLHRPQHRHLRLFQRPLKGHARRRLVPAATKLRGDCLHIKIGPAP